MKQRTIGIGIILGSLVAFGVGFQFLAAPLLDREKPQVAVADDLFGWKYPVVRFPTTGPGEIAYSDIRDPGGIPSGLPVRLQVPTIGVDTAIEDALITPDGRMDVPQGSVNVAWFALGPQPGQEGSAVIGGHFGTRNGVPFVFYNLDKIKIGDRIFIVDDRDNTLAFVVRSIRLFDRDADATPVFTSDDGLAHLNLITCEGIWNQVNDTYPQRRVVFADAVSLTNTPAEPGDVKAAAPATLSLGATGADVIALQTVLVQRGFLVYPPGVSKGYFGPLTHDALAKYQISVGLPSTGILDPKTRATLLTVEGGLPVAGEPTLPVPTPTPTPTPEQTPPAATPVPSVVVQTTRSLFSTPIDGLITSLLIAAIGFVAYRIIRR